MTLHAARPLIYNLAFSLRPAMIAAGCSGRNNCDQYFIDIQVSLPYTPFSRK
jgi:hypothetical protein